MEKYNRREFIKKTALSTLLFTAGGCLAENKGKESIWVKKALKNQKDLIKKRERCSLFEMGNQHLLGRQVRVKRDKNNYALYTVSEVRTENGKIMRMGASGRERLGTNNECNVILDWIVPHPTISENKAKQVGEFIERLRDTGNHAGLVACAPHGGYVERYTDEQAEHVAIALSDKGVSSWCCKGWKQGGGAYSRWHITSNDIHRKSFPGLDSIADRGFTYAVSFHGFKRGDILIGGAAPLVLKSELQSAIMQAIKGSGITVSTTTSGAYSGTNPKNFVNWLTRNGRNGIQIEQSYKARKNYGIEIASAVADVFRGKI